MKKKIKISVVLILLILKQGYAQELTKQDSLSRENAKKVVEQNFGKHTQESSYIVFSMNDKLYLIVLEKDGYYEEHYFVDSTKTKIEKVNKPSDIYSAAFDTTLYHKGYITFNSDFYKNGYTKAWGELNYFLLKAKNGQEYGELRLSTIVEPNPINSDIYYYLITRLLNNIDNDCKNKRKNKNKNSGLP